MTPFSGIKNVTENELRRHPAGEATSMSVGDVIEDPAGAFHAVGMLGFNPLA